MQAPQNDNASAPRSERILVVEDEENLALGIRDALEHAGFAVEVALDGPSGLEAARSGNHNLMVLDLMLPGISGLEILERVRTEQRDLRVLILTARANESDVVHGLEMGADDYMCKPFAPRELVARVAAQFRRREIDTSPPPRLELPGDISVDLERLEVHRDEGVLQLTPREGDILRYLIQNAHRVVTRDDLLVDVWHYSNGKVETRTVDIHIVGLRRKVEPNPSSPSLIQTVRGKGYRWYS
ncbi:MAG: response regulator transcription factor [Planctomycetota bacterium]|jgi:two-component system alkaline phosphatase synthesis response regulator PhoP|nr:response regulator transcription factor [Planctomycetota bacterium]MDP6763440.1 response regulator transcription factor [Planctomycetota bacterium]MDP6989612.1 response regulator transcription factor [Planctomycetota bacterium]